MHRDSHNFEELWCKKEQLIGGCQTKDDMESRTLFCLSIKFWFFKMGCERGIHKWIEIIQRERVRREKDTCCNKVHEQIG